MIEELADSSDKAAATLGVASVARLGLADQRLDAHPLIEVTQALEAHVARVRPEVVYTHFAGDANVDHGVVARATWTACRPYVAPYLRRFLVFETPSSTEWGWPALGPAFEPTVFVDVTATLEVKLEARAAYDSELRPHPHPRSLQALRDRATFWGSVVGSCAAEPFMLLREVER
jgi:LmbE family N-acetylglucosaminyl deacetylase